MAGPVVLKKRMRASKGGVGRLANWWIGRFAGSIIGEVGGGVKPMPKTVVGYLC